MENKISRKTISLEIMKYKKDKLSYSLTLLGLIANVFYFISLYKNNDNFYYTYEMGLSIIYNLLFMLLVFLSAENVKVYKKSFGFVLIAIGIMQLLRIFIYPLKAFQAGALPENSYTWIIIYLAISAICLISGAIVNIVKSTRLNRFLASETENKFQKKGE